MTLSPPLQQVDCTFVRCRNRKLSYFGGCDYFRLASHPKILKAVRLGLTRYGLNVAASRVTTGNHVVYGELEHTLAKFFRVESATLASNGYLPSLMVAQALRGQFSHALLDEHAHGCLVDAAKLLDCPVLRFKHCDTSDFARVVRRFAGMKPLLLTDGMFSSDGRIAPLKEYLDLLPRGAMILVDDAHGVGVLGKQGRGSLEHAGVSSDQIIQTMTLGKAFGVYGGAVLGTHRLRSTIQARSRIFSGNTPLPPPLAFAALKSAHILATDKKLRNRLIWNTQYIKAQLVAVGFPVVASPSPIISFNPKNTAETRRLTKSLLARGIHAPFIKYPGGPPNGYFRFAISSEHTRPQLDGLIDSLAELAAFK